MTTKSHIPASYISISSEHPSVFCDISQKNLMEKFSEIFPSAFANAIEEAAKKLGKTDEKELVLITLFYKKEMSKPAQIITHDDISMSDDLHCEIITSTQPSWHESHAIIENIFVILY